ncbi:hypothetical protein [Flavobacterium sp. UBA7682]|uniref:hypothetical protein n=1 Tax=Flavobacterium sp. UBA7682 TaxID=1946560 RepID=UPI0025BCE238|nr:hypothetical protein [Flavobacterium sp. UBA7682]
MNFEIKLNTSNTNHDLHSDILVSFQGINDNEIIDSYYFFDGINSSSKENYYQNLGFKLIEKIKSWIKEIDKDNLSKDNLFVIDISDEYIGAFRLYITDELGNRLSYGIIRNPITFEIRDFINEFEANSFVELYVINPQISISDFKDNLKSSIDLILHQINDIN